MEQAGTLSKVEQGPGDAGNTAREVRSRENTRERLLGAAAHVFADKGLGGATVDDLTTAAGFTRGAFYSNFSSKEEVFELAVLQLLERIIDQTRAGTRDAALGGDVFGQVRRLFRAIESDVRLFQRIDLEARLSALRRPELRETYARMRASQRAAVAGILAEASAAQGRRLTIPAADLAESLIALYFNATTAAELEGRDASVAVVVTTLVEAFTE